MDKYGGKAVRKQSRSVNVDFGVVVDADDNTDYRGARIFWGMANSLGAKGAFGNASADHGKGFAEERSDEMRLY